MSKSTVDRITDEVKGYYSVPSDTSDIIGMIERRKRLSVLAFGLSRELAELYTEKNGAEYRRKSAQGKVMAKAFADNVAASKAVEMAKIEADEQVKDELQSDALYRGTALILNQANEVLACMSQQISHMKQEHRSEANGTGSQ